MQKIKDYCKLFRFLLHYLYYRIALWELLRRELENLTGFLFRPHAFGSCSLRTSSQRP